MQPPFFQVVLFGSSMTWSMRAPYGKRYADCLEMALAQAWGPKTVVDVAACGAGGNTAREALPRLQRDCLAYHPDVVVVSLGANDCGREEKPLFESAYRAIIDGVRQTSPALVVCETVPVLDDIWHAFREREFARGPGGINGHLEAFAHSFIRDLCNAENLRLHDRFHLYHQAVKRNPARREELIRTDGVHLTDAGNAFFAQTLAELILRQPGNGAIAAALDPAEALNASRQNPALQKAMKAAADADSLTAFLLDEETTTRLLLQQARSLARRAAATSSNPRIVAEGDRLARLAGAFLAAQRVLKPANPQAESGSRHWGRTQISGLADPPRALKQILRN